MPTILAEARGLSKDFPVKGKKGALLHGVSQVDLQVYEGETLALVGESGCGKSTLGRLLLGLLPPTEGQVLFDGQDLAQCTPKELRALRRQMQMVFQDSGASLNPRKRVGTFCESPCCIMALPSGRMWTAASKSCCLRLALRRKCASVIRMNFPAVSGSASALRGRFRWSREYWCWTSRSARWTCLYRLRF